jgi:hypothetical protein
MDGAEHPSLRWRRPLLVLGLLVLLVLYLLGAYQQLTLVNLDAQTGDQSAYLDYARSVHADPLGFVGPRNRMPVFPSLLSLLYSPDLSAGDYFERCKRFNVLLSLLLLLGLYPLLRVRLQPGPALLLLGIAAATVFVWRCAYVQVELLFYALFLAAFAAGLRLFDRPSLLKAGLAGAVGAAAYLTKASALPLVAGTVLLLLVQQAFQRWRPSPGAEPDPAPPRPALVALVFAATFLILVSPYLANNQRYFGRWFYNVNTAHVAWYDDTPDWSNIRPGADPLQYAEQVRAMPSAEIHSPGRFWREHTLGEMVARLVGGALFYARYEGMSQFMGQLFLGIYLLLPAAFCLQHRHRVRGWLSDSRLLFMALFGAGIFLGYSLLVCFYAGVVVGDRFIQPLFLPAWYAAFLVLRAFETEGCTLHTPWGELTVSRLHRVVACLLAVVIVVWMPSRIGVIRADD